MHNAPSDPRLAWALRHDATTLDLIAESHTGLLARRAERFSFPVSVWYPVERALLPAVAEPLAAPPPTRPAISQSETSSRGRVHI